jgi:hypothetical protein
MKYLYVNNKNLSLHASNHLFKVNNIDS